MADKKYTHVNSGGGFAIKCNPSDRAVDVMHALITGSGTGLGGRSIDGVDYEILSGEDMPKEINAAARALRKCMEITAESKK
jgi:hypothetical protein